MVSGANFMTCCGALAAGFVSHRWEYSNTVTAVAAIVGGIASRVLFNFFTEPAESENDFKPFHLDIEKFGSVGFIEKDKMFAHRSPTLINKPLCSYLRKMDTQEYDRIKTESDEVAKIDELRRPAYAALAGATVGGIIGSIVLWPISLLGLLGSSSTGAFIGGVGFYAVSIKHLAQILEKNRAARLDEKIIQLAKQIILPGPIEVNQQLQLARRYFFGNFQDYITEINTRIERERQERMMESWRRT